MKNTRYELACGITGSQLGERVERLLTHGRRFSRGASILALAAIAIALIATIVAVGKSPEWIAFAQAPPASRATPANPAPSPSPAPATRPGRLEEERKASTLGFLLEEDRR